MKFRTDFVTNSSSSCFCVTLSLKFDNGQSLTDSDGKSIGEEYENCVFGPQDGNRSSGSIGYFSKIVKLRNNIPELKELLERLFKKAQIDKIDGASKLTEASLSMNGCARGEESWRVTAYRMLGLDGVPFSSESVEENIQILKKSGLDNVEEDGLKQIIYYQDMGEGSNFEDNDEVEDMDIWYDEGDLTKSIECTMTPEGKISIEVSHETAFADKNWLHN